MATKAYNWLDSQPDWLKQLFGLGGPSTIGPTIANAKALPLQSNAKEPEKTIGAQPSGDIVTLAKELVKAVQDQAGEKLDFAREESAARRAATPGERDYARETLVGVGASDPKATEEQRRKNDFRASLDRNRANPEKAPYNASRGTYVDAMGGETTADQQTPQGAKYGAFTKLLEAEGNRRLGEQREPMEAALMGTSSEAKIVTARRLLGSPDPRQRIAGEEMLRDLGIRPEY